MRLVLASLCVLATGALTACGSSTPSATAPPIAATATPAATPASVGGATATPATAATPTAPATPAGVPGVGTATIKGTLTLAGSASAASLSGSAPYSETVTSDVTGGNACADFARRGDPAGSEDAFRLALPSVTIGGQAVVFSGGPTGKVGPGQFHNDPTQAFTGFDITVGDQASDYQDPGTGTYALTVNADGSGNLVFTGFGDEMGSDGILGGSVTWTCG